MLAHLLVWPSSGLPVCGLSDSFGVVGASVQIDQRFKAADPIARFAFRDLADERPVDNGSSVSR